MRTLLWAPVLLALLVLAALTPAQPVTSASRQAPLLLGAVYPLSGPQGAGGRDELGGVQTALALINAAGGVDGRPVQLQIKDAPDPQAGVAAVDSLVQQDHVPAILGGYSSVISVAASAEANRLHTIWWESGAVAALEDEAGNAERVTACGVGEALSPDAKAAEIADSLSRVLSDSATRAAARGFAARDSGGRAAELVEGLLDANRTAFATTG